MRMQHSHDAAQSRMREQLRVTLFPQRQASSMCTFRSKCIRSCLTCQPGREPWCSDSRGTPRGGRAVAEVDHLMALGAPFTTLARPGLCNPRSRDSCRLRPPPSWTACRTTNPAPSREGSSMLPAQGGAGPGTGDRMTLCRRPSILWLASGQVRCCVLRYALPYGLCPTQGHSGCAAALRPVQDACGAAAGAGTTWYVCLRVFFNTLHQNGCTAW